MALQNILEASPRNIIAFFPSDDLEYTGEMQDFLTIDEFMNQTSFNQHDPLYQRDAYEEANPFLTLATTHSSEGPPEEDDEDEEQNEAEEAPPMPQPPVPPQEPEEDDKEDSEENDDEDKKQKEAENAPPMPQPPVPPQAPEEDGENESDEDEQK